MTVIQHIRKLQVFQKYDAIGKLATEVYKSQNPPYFDIYSHATINNTPKTFETYYEPMDKYFHISVVPLGKNRFATVTTDITELKIKEQEIEKSETLFRSIFESFQDVYFRYNKDFIVELISPSIKQIGGYEPEEIIGKSALEFYSNKEDHQKVINILLDKGQIYDYEVVLNKKNGEPFICSVNAKILRDEEGNFAGAEGTIRDITQRKQLEQMLQESEQRYRTLFDQTRDPIMILEPPSWHFKAANPAAMQLFGIKSDEELQKLTPWAISPEFQSNGESSEKKALKMIDTAMRNGSHSFEWTHRSLDGKLLYFSILLSKIEIGGKVFLQVSMRDITELKRKEEELKNSEARNKALLQAIPDIMFIFDKSGVFVDFSYQKPENLLLLPEQFIGKKAAEVLPEELAILTIDKLEKVFQTKQIQTYEYSLEIKGEVKYYESRLVYMDENHALAIVSDITERKRLEDEKKKLQEQLIQAQKLESIGRLAGGVAHDFNNMLEVILGFTDLCMRKIEQYHPIYSYLEKIKKNS
ncbi:PAS domain-containing protein [Thermodesulfovibrio hydrogeniphilus]